MNRNRRRRGAATVELAVTMIVIVPLTAYTLFLEDFLVYYLDWQEAIVTSPWDYTALNYNKSFSDDAVGSSSNAKGLVGALNRAEFCDHSAAYASYNISYDCGERHHVGALAAHQCWLAGGEQVTCGVQDPDIGAFDKNIPAVGSLLNFSDLNEGGIVRCTAQLGVQNYIIVNKFLNAGNGGGARVEVTSSTKYAAGTKIHGNAYSGGGWVFGAKNPDYFSIVVDPWAVNNPGKIDSDSTDDNHPIYKRMKKYYGAMPPTPPNTGFSVLAGTAALAFGADLMSENLLGPLAMLDWPMESQSFVGDNPVTPSMYFDPASESRTGKKDFVASAWNDDSRQEKTFKNRKDAYFGFEDSAW